MNKATITITLSTELSKEDIELIADIISSDGVHAWQDGFYDQLDIEENEEFLKRNSNDDTTAVNVNIKIEENI